MTVYEEYIAVALYFSADFWLAPSALEPWPAIFHSAQQQQYKDLLLGAPENARMRLYTALVHQKCSDHP